MYYISYNNFKKILFLFGKTCYLGYNKGMKADVLIVGGGPAGLTAGIFLCRAGLNAIMFEKLAIGGQAGLSYKIANYPGFETISGFELTERMHKHAESFGLKTEMSEVTSVSKTKTGFSVKTKNGSFFAPKVILACGCAPRKLNLQNEKKFLGKGVSFCASCDGNFFKNKQVAVVGGGETAIEDVDYLSKIASQIYLINHNNKFYAAESEVERIKKYKNLQIILNANIVKYIGDKNLEQIEIEIKNKKQILSVNGVFVAIGSEPNLNFLKFDIKRDKKGYIVVDANMQTSEKNLYACGDVISKTFRQVVNACAEGATAANACIGKK